MKDCISLQQLYRSGFQMFIITISTSSFYVSSFHVSGVLVFFSSFFLNSGKRRLPCQADDGHTSIILSSLLQFVSLTSQAAPVLVTESKQRPVKQQ